jgi:hypothetical protein
MSRDLLLITQPKTVLISSRRPSACSFLIEMMSFLGIMSCLEAGLAIVRKANGIARQTLVGTLPKSGATPIESSIKMSVFPKSFGGMEIERSLA